KFPENGWIRDSFSYDICSSTLHISEKEQLIDLISDYTLRNQFKTPALPKILANRGKAISRFYARMP
ncbi:hypothetical protein TNCV_2602581, partial [Trichonephila clavipes]